MLLNIGYGLEVDCWAFGVLIFKMLTAAFPFEMDGNDVSAAMHIICDQPNMNKVQLVTNNINVYRLIEALLNKNPYNRLGRLFP